MNLVFRNNLEIKRLTKVDFETKEEDFVNLQNRIFSSEDMYPGIDLWFKNRVIPGVHDSQRIAYIGYYNGNAVASAIVKIDKSAKFCHLNIDDRFQDCNFGELFFILMTFDVGRLAEEIHFTLPESLWDKKKFSSNPLVSNTLITAVTGTGLLRRNFIAQSPILRCIESLKRSLRR